MLLKDDKLLLEIVIVRSSVRDNPLQIVAMVKHACFVCKVIHYKPELAEELNDQAFVTYAFSYHPWSFYCSGGVVEGNMSMIFQVPD